jgi:hypothetical protein
LYASISKSLNVHITIIARCSYTNTVSTPRIAAQTAPLSSISLNSSHSLVHHFGSRHGILTRETSHRSIDVPFVGQQHNGMIGKPIPRISTTILGYTKSACYYCHPSAFAAEVQDSTYHLPRRYRNNGLPHRPIRHHAPSISIRTINSPHEPTTRSSGLLPPAFISLHSLVLPPTSHLTRI